jgi:ParB family chromosome partitioning protein
MEHTKELLSISLSNLVPSPYNVRRHSAGQVEELAALIGSQGLLHPLIVTEQVAGRGKARKVRFAVAAGERRRRALLLLQQRGELPKAHEVLCELVPPERALELSVAENSGREALHPGDVFESFKAMVDAGKGIEDVAARFGVSALTVQRRLKLSAVSPKLLALYRQDGINLDQLMALALSDDHAAQERAWFDAQPWDQTPAALRRKLTAGEIEATGHALVRFVGIEAYEAAGGVVRRDLFDDEQSRFLSDPALLQRLAIEKLEVLAEGVRREGWAWVEARVEVDSQALRQFTPCDHVLREPTPQEQKDLAALTRRNDELEQQARALDDAPEWSADEAECIDLEEQDVAARCKAIRDGLKTWAPDAMAHAGVIVTVSREGDAEVIRGLVRDADRRAFASAQKVAGRAASGAESDLPDTSTSRPANGECREPGCGESLAKRLAAHRTVALQVMLSRNTAVALAALAHVFVQRTFGDEYRRAGSALQITAQPSGYALASVADDLKQSAAWQAIEAARLAWKQRLPDQPSDWFAWLIALPQADLLNLLALCAALTLNALPSAGAADDANVLVGAVGMDMADWWEPTAHGYLNHVPKAQIVQALKEAGPDLANDGVDAMKKDVLVVTAAARLAGRRWLPATLRQPTV